MNNIRANIVPHDDLKTSLISFYFMSIFWNVLYVILDKHPICEQEHPICDPHTWKWDIPLSKELILDFYLSIYIQYSVKLHYSNIDTEMKKMAWIEKTKKHGSISERLHKKTWTKKSYITRQLIKIQDLQQVSMRRYLVY